MKRLILILSVMANAVQGFSQDTNAAKSVGAYVAAFFEAHPVEKAYLQFDKPYYAAGDTMYFKAVVTGGGQHKMSQISRVLHVDLINMAGKIDQSIKLSLDSGLAWGDFTLPDSLPQGNYRIRAYTRWMRNETEPGFFEKVIPIASVKAANLPGSVAKQAISGLKPDIQFLPEGGSLVTGINTKIAFKAVGPNGLGVDVTGTVFDSDHKQVAAFSSGHLGMGSFNITPAAGKTYTAKVNYPDGSQDVIELPKPVAEGISLAIDNDALSEATVSISANEEFFGRHKDGHFTLLIYSGGQITTVNCRLDSHVIKLDILKRKLRTGVTRVTLFSPAGEPLCERLFFVQNYDQLSIALQSDKSAYSKRDGVTIKVNVMNRKEEPVGGHFAVSVINENLAPQKEAYADNILSCLLLTSDLKGHIEQPGYYFADTSAITQKNLDLVMLTHGYRSFTWQQMLDSAAAQSPFKAEEALSISGKATSLGGKPIANGTVNLISRNGGPLLTARTDNTGLFQFTGFFFTDTAHFVLNAVNAKGKNSTMISYCSDKTNYPAVSIQKTYQNAETADTTIKIYAANAQLQHDEYLYHRPANTTMLKQVDIKAKKTDDNYNRQSIPGAGFADQVIHSKDVLYGGPLSVRLAGMIPGTRYGIGGSVINNETRKPFLIIIDGYPGKIDDVATDGFSTIEVLKPPASFIYDGGENGVLVITTKPRGPDPEDIPSIGVLPISVMGFYKARQFYSPKYDNPAALNSKQRDLRSTIYWNPEIKTDTDGNAVIDFFNADGAGTYTVTIEGIDKDGNIGRQVYRYEVK